MFDKKRPINDQLRPIIETFKLFAQVLKSTTCPVLIDTSGYLIKKTN